MQLRRDEDPRCGGARKPVASDGGTGASRNRAQCPTDIERELVALLRRLDDARFWTLVLIFAKALGAAETPLSRGARP